MKPLIGITVDAKPDPSNPITCGKLELNWNYAQAVADAGGVPVLIPPQADVSALAHLIDGWLIPGGTDIDPSLFGQERHEKTVLINKDRFRTERELYEQLPEEAPVLGICYGCQFLNVVRGGTLIQHLPDVIGVEHHSGHNLDVARIESGSKLQKAVGSDCVEGNGNHHQAVGDLGYNLRVTARHEDGTIEAVEATDRPWMVAVQWHPERTPESEATRRLFRSFIEAARQYREGRH